MAIVIALIAVVGLALFGMLAVRTATILREPPSSRATTSAHRGGEHEAMAGSAPAAPGARGAGPGGSDQPGSASGAGTAAAGTTGGTGATAGDTSDPAARERRIVEEMRNVSVTIYTADYCGWCRKAKAHLASRGFAYSERKIDESADAKREMRRLGGSGIPTFDIEGEVHSGYDPTWVESTIRAQAERRVTALR